MLHPNKGNRVEEIIWDDDTPPDEDAMRHIEDILSSPLWGVKTNKPIFRVHVDNSKYTLLEATDLQELIRISNELGQKGNKIIGYEFINGGKGVSLIYERKKSGMPSM